MGNGTPPTGEGFGIPPPPNGRNGVPLRGGLVVASLVASLVVAFGYGRAAAGYAAAIQPYPPEGDAFGWLDGPKGDGPSDWIGMD